MARAKRTDRAEARRRYRATLAESEVDESETDDDDAAAEAVPAAKAGSGTPRVARPNQLSAQAPDAGGPQRRPGFTDSFRLAARPFNLQTLRGDLGYLPQLLLRTPAVAIPGVISILAGVLFLIPPTGSNAIGALLFPFFIYPPFIGPFLAGALAPRATYLAGGITAIIALVVLAIAVIVTPFENTNQLTGLPGTTAAPGAVASPTLSSEPSASPAESAAASPTPSGEAGAPAPPIDKGSLIFGVMLEFLPLGFLVGGLGGFYRRFLNISTGKARARGQQGRARPKQAPRRR